MNNKQEYILCAAIWCPNIIPKKDLYLPINIKEGIVICGRRHHDCLSIISYCKLNRTKHVQGFLTSTNHFVTREEAVAIAFNAGQIENTKFNSKLLFSEDLY